MPTSTGARALLALAVAALSLFAGLLIGGNIEATLLALVGVVAAILIAVAPADPPGAPAAAPAPTSSDLPIQEVIEAIAEPVLIVTDRRVVAVNRSASALLGDHILGEDVRVAIRHPAAAERLMRTDDPSPGAPVHLVGLGNRDQRWEMRVRTIGERRIVHLIDRTGSYTNDRIRVDFVANASHELRTPLAAVLGYVETLREEAGEDPATRDRFLGIMFDEARRMQRLVEDLISLSRIEAEKYRAPGQSVDLAQLIHEVRDELAAGARSRAGDIRIETEEIPPVRGDRAQLSQLLHNIIGNAMKYGREGTPVSIRLSPGGDNTVRLTVADEGEGIAAEHIPRLTERFYRVDSGRSRAMGGTGLGLAIVKHIVERHRGRLDIASATGKGTTVTILLPAQALS